jgi:hypothetical protein
VSCRFLALESDENPLRFPFPAGWIPLGVVLNSAGSLELLGRQFWVADVAQLVASGLSPRTIARARRAGILVGVLPGVVRLAGAPDTFESRAMALLLHAGEPSFLSGATAGRLLGLRGMPTYPMQVTTRERRQLTSPPWARYVSSSWIDPDVDIVERPDGLRVAHPLRMLFGIAGRHSQRFLERAAEDAWHLGLVRPDDAAAYLAAIRRSGRGGVKKFEEWLLRVERSRRPSQSRFELDVRDVIRKVGLPEPVPQYELALLSGEVIHIDLAWPDVRLGVEPGHSWWHGGDLGQRRDQARDRACDAVGWRIVRYDEEDRKDLAAIGRELKLIHAERRRSLRLRV